MTASAINLGETHPDIMDPSIVDRSIWNLSVWDLSIQGSSGLL
jgi:hypothetical protein